jgi:short subunit dehydrogenase-like uncharacterized protein
MAGISTRVVRRSNALQGWAYGRRFRYREVTGFGAGPAGAVKGAAVAAAVAGVTAGLGSGPSRALLGHVLPQPGQGSSGETRRAGLFRMKIRTSTSAGVRYVASAAARSDPGYQATSVMLGESGLRHLNPVQPEPDARRQPPESGHNTAQHALRGRVGRAQPPSAMPGKQSPGGCQDAGVDRSMENSGTSGAR